MSYTQNLWRCGCSVALGSFIVWQLFYLTVANSLETLEVVTLRYPETSSAITKALDESRAGHRSALGGLSSLVYAVDKYGQVTEQPQRWSLFAPNINDQTTFLACEFRWNDSDQSTWLLSDNEPSDASSYLRYAGNRIRSIEQNLTLTFAFEPGESEADARQRWAEQIHDKLATDFDILMVWASLRVEEFQADYPYVATPDEVILHVRGFEIGAPGREADQTSLPYCMAIARWQPAVDYPRECLPLEAYDPVTEQFVYQTWPSESE
ncbi:hypothetical protein LOC68_19590 [Blastopirellula sp. JC732]|uniref:Uncharacterized protein n=1 Tax=Blastopirellula sediminis TaxID=2894196 RepID=A0A9X1MNM7_9BACT|nr:hypothetical protein [Blastopirellula sediminis]MCC9606098.1 hypothetical protein [Blastopirellula sediminis]MCC9630603.1 hypothetical protein [Blastopirellula sediminis]